VTQRWPDALSVDLQWTYLATKGRPYAQPVRVQLHRSHVLRQFEAIEVVTGEIRTLLSNRKLKKGLRLAPDEASKIVLDLPPNTSQCEAYGGCPYQDRCNLSPVQSWSAFLNKPSTAAINVDALFSSLAKPSDGPSEPPPAPSPEPSPTPSPEEELPVWLKSATD